MNKFLVLIPISLFCFLVFGLIALADTTTQTLTINPGALSITTNSSVAFSAVSVSSSNQTTNTTSTGLTVADLRGTGAGWSLTVTSNNLTLNGSTSTMSGSNNTVNFTGTYNGVASSTNANGHGIYTVEITTGGLVGTAAFKWTNPASSTTTGVTTASSVVLDSGVSVAFGSATYVIGDKWRFNVSSQPYTGITVTPSNLQAINSSNLVGVSLGSSGLFIGSGATSNARSILTGEFGRGVGAYSVDLGLLLTVLKNSLSGSHGGTLTISAA